MMLLEKEQIKEEEKEQIELTLPAYSMEQKNDTLRLEYFDAYDWTIINITKGKNEFGTIFWLAEVDSVNLTEPINEKDINNYLSNKSIRLKQLGTDVIIEPIVSSPKEEDIEYYKGVYISFFTNSFNELLAFLELLGLFEDLGFKSFS